MVDDSGKMLNKLSLPVIRADKNYKIIFANSSSLKFYGYTLTQIKKLSLLDLDPNLKKLSKKELKDQLSQQCFICTHLTKNGKKNEIILHTGKVKKGKSFEYLLFVTEKKHASEVLMASSKEFNAELESSEKNKIQSIIEKQFDEMRLRFLSASSHEFRTPLTTILTSSEVLLMLRRTLPEDRFVDYIIQIQNAVAYMTSLLDDMLTYNKTEVGKWKFSPSKVDLVKLCLKMIDDAKNVSNSNHAVKFDYKLGNNTVFVDDKLLQHIISNLLSNAIKYSPIKKKIEFLVEKSESNILFIVKDYGIGIKKEDQDKLFETFYRGKNIGKIEGTGLGLSIVKRCVESHGGKVTFESKLDKGTTFYVTIPMMALI